MRKMFVVLVCALLLACSQTSNGDNSQESAIASTGDTVKVNYVGKFLNGTVFDTNIEDVARSNGIEKDRFGPISITLGEGQVVRGFENAVNGMEVGQTKEVTLTPEQAYGTEDQSGIVTLNRTRSMNRTRELPRRVSLNREQLRQVPGNTTEGATVQQGNVSYTVIRRVNGTATLEVDVEEGDVITMPETGWDATVVSVGDDDYVVRQDPEDGTQVDSPFGPVTITVQDQRLVRTLDVEEGGRVRSQQGTGTVTTVNESNVEIDFNHPLAGKNVTFEIELVDIVG